MKKILSILFAAALILSACNKTTPVSSIILDKTSLELSVGGSDVLVPAIFPLNADNKNVTWSSGNTSVATVDQSGKVTAVAPGTADITVTTEEGGWTATCMVTVKANTFTVTFDVQGYGTAPESQTLESGSKVTKPEDPTAEGLTFGGWFKETACTDIWDFDNDEVTSDITLYAKWTALEMTIPEEALTGEFSVSATRKVYFSKGNLVATIDASGAPVAWKFAANQYDCLGAGGANQTIGSAAGDIDLFGWSTDGASAEYGINTSTDGSDYSGDFLDWGKAIGDGNTWRTLSKDEWVYLFNTRTVNGGTGVGKSYSRDITYGGKMGLVLYPDNYAGPTLSGTLESLPEGAAFLPAASNRDGSSVIFIYGDYGNYWSSSADDEVFAFYLNFSSNDVYPGTAVYRYRGNSVRLVTDVPAE